MLYHFGVRLQSELNVPVGLINASWGGSRIEPWLVEEKSSRGMYNGMIAPVHPPCADSRGIMAKAALARE